MARQNLRNAPQKNLFEKRTPHLSDTPDEEETSRAASSDDYDQDRVARRNAQIALRELQARAQHDARTGPQTDAEEWFRFESESLVSWAKETGRLLDTGEFELLTAHFRRFEGGQEHQVMFHRELGRVLKVTRPPHFGCEWALEHYVTNIIRTNVLLGDDIRLEGVLNTSEGTSLVVSQPFILGKWPTDAQIKAWFEGQGYVLVRKNKWRHPNGVIVSDTHRGNFIRMRNGVIVPIDLQVESLGNIQIPSIENM